MNIKQKSRKKQQTLAGRQLTQNLYETSRVNGGIVSFIKKSCPILFEDTSMVSMAKPSILNGSPTLVRNPKKNCRPESREPD